MLDYMKRALQKGNRASKRPTWISHRGYTQKFAENTRAAFDAARKAGFDMIETDLRVTADGHIVLYHDRTLTKLGRPDLSIEQLTKAEVSALRHPCGAELMFFDEFITRYRGWRWVFDIKKESALRTIKLLQGYERSLFEQDTIFLCERRRHERQLRALFPSAEFFARKSQCYLVGIAMLLGAAPLLTLPRGKTYAVSAHLWGKSLFQPEVFARYQSKGARVVAYLPPNDKQARQAVAAGADMVLTDYTIV